MKKIQPFILFFVLILIANQIQAQAPQIIPASHPGIVGLWEFENSSNLTLATLKLGDRLKMIFDLRLKPYRVISTIFIAVSVSLAE